MITDRHDIFSVQKSEEEAFRLQVESSGRESRSLRSSAQGLRAVLGRPSAEAVARSKRAVLLELATAEVKKKEEEEEESRGRRQSSPTLFRSLFTGDFVSRDDADDASDALVSSRSSPRRRRLPPLTFSAPECPEEEAEGECRRPDGPFRTFSGRCNNLSRPHRGRHTSTFLRLLPPQYDDGISVPRGRSAFRESLRGRQGFFSSSPLFSKEFPLPNVRSVSSAIHQAEEQEGIMDRRHSLLLMQWGQFLDHDLTLTPMFRGHNDSILDCGGCRSNARHPGCYPILVPTGDGHFPTRDVDPSSGFRRSPDRKCIPFTRSIPGQDALGPREQVNQVTAYLDCSHIYGSNPCRCECWYTPFSTYVRE